MSATVIKSSASSMSHGGHIIPRTTSPEALEGGYNSELTASISTDTRSRSTDSYHSKSIPIRKPSRFGSLFSSNSSRSGLKMTSMGDQNLLPEQQQPAPTSNNISQNLSSSFQRRGSSGAQSFRSVESSSFDSNQRQSSPSHKFSRSIGNLISSPASWTKKHLHNHNHSHSESYSPSNNVPKLHEKYGDYVKPNKKATTKASGATNKHNIGSGATAVIRLVQSQNRILAVKEFRKKDKTEDEKEYLKRMHSEYCISKAVSGHPNVVETMDLVVDEQDRWCTVMEYVRHFEKFSICGKYGYI